MAKQFKLNPITGDLDYVQGINPLEPVEGIQFDLDNPTTPSAEGLLTWNDDDGTLNLGLKGGDVNLQVGLESVIRVKASEDISNGEMVYIDGADGANPTVSLAQASSEAIAHATLAMATEDINNNQFGYVTTFGLVRDINTSSWAAGTELYLDASTPGTLTNTEPSDPNYSVTVGYVIRSHTTEGTFFVRVHPDIWKTKLTGYVPYTGATTDVDLGTNNITAGTGTFGGTSTGDSIMQSGLVVNEAGLGTNDFRVESLNQYQAIFLDSSADQLNINVPLVSTSTLAGSNLSGTNTGDQTDIADFTGTKSQFDTACTDGDFAYSGGSFHDGFSDFVANEHIDWTNATQDLLTTGDGKFGNLGVGASAISNAILKGTLSSQNVIGLDLTTTSQFKPSGDKNSYIIKLDHTQSGGGVTDTVMQVDFAGGGGSSANGIVWNYTSSGGSTFNPWTFTATVGSGVNLNVLDNSLTTTGSGGTSSLTKGDINLGGAFANLYGSLLDIDDTSTAGPNTAYGSQVLIDTNTNFPTFYGSSSKYGYYSILQKTGTVNTVNFYNHFGQYKPTLAGDKVYGLYLDNTAGTINNPTQDQIGIYVNNDASGTDTNMKRWAFFNAGTKADASKVLLGKDDVKAIFGSGYDAGIWYDGNDLHIDAQLVGSGTIILDNLPTSASGLPTGGVWNNSGVLNIA